MIDITAQQKQPPITKLYTFSLLDLTTTRPPNQRTILPNVPPRNDFVANASVSPDYTPFDATFQDRTTFIHHGAYHVAWMFLMGVPRILEMLQLLWNDFWTCTKQMLKTNVLAKVSKYPSLALKVLVLLWDNFELVSSFGSFRYLTPTNYRLTPLPGHGAITSPTMASLAGQPMWWDAWLHWHTAFVVPSLTCCVLTTRITWVSFVMDFCVKNFLQYSCLRPPQVVLEPLFFEFTSSHCGTVGWIPKFWLII